ncbi:MAG: PAS domain S-box protein [Dehalococcoidia bacterium]
MGEHNIGLCFHSNVAGKVSSPSELSFLIDRIMRMTQKALKATASSVLLIDSDKQDMFFEFADGPVGALLKEVTFSVQSGIAGWVVLNREPAIVNDVAKDSRFYVDVDRATGFVTKSILCAPLKLRGRVIGVIEVLNKLDGSDFTEQDLEVLEAVASTAAIAVALKQAEKALRASTEHYSALVESLPDAVLEFREGVVTWCNDRVEEICGYPKDELLGKNASSLFSSEVSPSEFIEEVSTAIKERGLFRGTTKFRKKDGTLVDIEYYLSQIVGRDPADVIAVARDITERKGAEEE